MACGAKLCMVTKEEVASRVPPRALAGHEEFWECDRCGQVFWPGTHWRRIDTVLADMHGGKSNEYSQDLQ